MKSRTTRWIMSAIVGLTLAVSQLHGATLNPDMEDLILLSGSYWNGSDLSGGFQSQWVDFNNSYNTDYFSWAGFAYSSVNNTNAGDWGNQYAVWTPGTGVGGGGNYAVGYDDAWDPDADTITFPFPACVKGFYVNNTAYAALTVENGDALCKKFGGATGDDPDWFMLTITGKDRSGTEVGTVDFYLADYRFANNAQDYIVGDWTWVDLASLGPDVKTLHFALSSTDNGAWGMNTPAYFAVDELQFIYTFSGYTDDVNLYDPPVPGYVGPDGDGSTNGANNYVNRAFAGWASSVADYSPAPNVASQWTNSANALGPVTGSNMDIVSLGDLDRGMIDSNTPPGVITLAFSTPISDEEGPDFAVFENAFPGGPDVFVELGYVEVSSDGTNFIRFPSVSLTTNAVGPYDAIDPQNVYNLCGKHINAYGDSWGTPFDLSDLACHAMVLQGTVDLSAVTRVRIVDIPGTGDFYDGFSPSNSVYDPWPTMTSGGVDLEAVGVINSPDYARIGLGINGPGSISPYGLPGPVVAVANGGNINFSIAAEPGHHILDVRINGVSIGATNSHTFVNVQTDQRLEADFGNILVVESAYGSCMPGVGTNYGYGPMTASVSGSPVEDGATQYVCVGWTGTGSVPATGSGTDTGRFSLTNDSVLTWTWAVDYWLNVESTRGGEVDAVSGWFGSGQSVTSTAAADPYYEFAGWSGDAEGDTNAPVMIVTMDRPRSLAANFWADVAVNDVPKAWLTAYGLTNAAPDEEAVEDFDGDLMDAWQEFFAGTDPRDASSVFEIKDFGQRGGSNYVVWVGGTNGSALPFAVLGCTNLLSGWTVLDGNVARSGSGTNTWWGERAADNMFWRIKVNTGN